MRVQGSRQTIRYCAYNALHLVGRLAGGHPHLVGYFRAERWGILHVGCPHSAGFVVCCWGRGGEGGTANSAERQHNI